MFEAWLFAIQAHIYIQDLSSVKQYHNIVIVLNYCTEYKYHSILEYRLY